MLQLVLIWVTLFSCSSLRIPKSKNYRSMSSFMDSRNGSLSSGLLLCASDGCRLNRPAMKATLRSFEGKFFKHLPYPADWNRYFVSWYSIAHTTLPSLSQSRHRVLLSSVRKYMGDGLGHMFFMYNFEVALATNLNLTFTHRHSTYQSLTKADNYAVDNFFGWGEGEIQRERIWDECTLSFSYYSNPSDTKKCIACESVEGHGPLGFRRVVNLPSFLVYNCTSRHGWSTTCDTLLHNVLARNNQSHTVFQIPPGPCDYSGTNSNTSRTGPWFREKYWKLHGKRVEEPWTRDFFGPRDKALTFDERRLNIAAHVRRGDFFIDKKRKMLSDRIYARTIADVLDMIDSMNGTFAYAPAVVHIYSEGCRNSKRGETVHDVNAMDKTYYNEKQRPRSASHWARLIKSMTRSDSRLRSNLREALEIRLHISEDTLDSMHEMIAADVFIGSASSMSSGPIYTLSRGVRLLTAFRPRENDPLFAQFDSKVGGILKPEDFFRAWRIYESANSHSLLQALRRRRR